NRSRIMPSITQVLRRDALVPAKVQVPFQFREDVVLVDHVVRVVQVLNDALQQEECHHLPRALIHQKGVDVTGRLIDERARTRHPVALLVAPTALEAVTQHLSAAVAMAVDLATARHLKQVDPSPRRQIEAQWLEPDTLPLWHPGYLVRVDGPI